MGNIKLGNIKETNGFAYVQQQLTRGKWLIDAGVRFDYLHFNYFDRLNENVLPGKSKGIICPKLNLQWYNNWCRFPRKTIELASYKLAL